MNNNNEQNIEELCTKEDASIKDVLAAVSMLNRKMDDGMRKMEENMEKMDRKIDTVINILNPLSNPHIQETPVVGDGALLSSEKNGVFTWFRFRPGEPDVLIGSAHTALRYTTIALTHNGTLIHPHPPTSFHFINLPDAVLKLGVQSIHFINTANMFNPLPSKLDICVLRVGVAPGSDVNVPQYASLELPGEEYSSSISHVVGKSIGSYVSSRGGAVTIKKDASSGLGQVEFLLDVGEPGDSGTLLRIKDEAGNYFPSAIFSGMSSSTTVPQMRGVACVIPPEEAFNSHFDVVGVAELANISHVVLGHQKGADNFHTVRRNESLNAVELQSHNTTLCGVFVKTEQPIGYMGDADIARMNSFRHTTNTTPQTRLLF